MPEPQSQSVGRLGLSARDCLTEDVMEAYLCGRLDELDSEQVQGHLLFCEPCNQLMEAEQEVYETLRGVARKAEAQRIATDTQARAHSRPSWWQGIFAAHRTRWATAAGSLALAAAVFMIVPTANRNETFGPYTTIVLTETRSGGPSSSGLAKRPIVLRADLAGLDASGPMVMQAVDETGSIVEAQRVPLEGPEAVWSLRTGLPAGQYWIRVAPAGNPSATLREYALSVR